jgi:hypothetical protein
LAERRSAAKAARGQAKGRSAAERLRRSLAPGLLPVLTPDVRAARLSNLTQVWVNNQRNVALVFAHGKVMITFWPAIYSNARKEFERFIAQNHVTATIGHVHRHPALVITPRTDSCGSNPAWVEFKRAGIDINVYSSGYGTGTLLSVADSLKPHTARHQAN